MGNINSEYNFFKRTFNFPEILKSKIIKSVIRPCPTNQFVQVERHCLMFALWAVAQCARDQEVVCSNPARIWNLFYPHYLTLSALCLKIGPNGDATLLICALKGAKLCSQGRTMLNLHCISSRKN